MDYNLVADILSKFHNASEPIQALWLTLTAAVLIAPFATVLAALRLRQLRRQPAVSTPVAEVFVGVVRAPDGRCFAYFDGVARELDEEDRGWIEAGGRKVKDGESGGGGVMH